MVGAISQRESIDVLAGLNYIRLELNTYLIMTHKKGTLYDTPELNSLRGQHVYMVSSTTLLRDLSFHRAFLSYRSDIHKDEILEIDSHTDMEIAVQYLKTHFANLDLQIEVDEKLHIYITRSEVNKLKYFDSVHARQLYQKIIQVYPHKKGLQEVWG